MKASIDEERLQLLQILINLFPNIHSEVYASIEFLSLFTKVTLSFELKVKRHLSFTEAQSESWFPEHAFPEGFYREYRFSEQ